MKPGPIGELFPSRTMSSIGDTPGFTTTSSPTETDVTLLPTASTMPATSQPGMCGSGGFGIPRVTHKSIWLSALATTRMRTSFSNGSGVVMSPHT